MIFGSFVLFIAACFLLLIFPPAAFITWLFSVVMFFAGRSARSQRNAVRKLDRKGERDARKRRDAK